MDRRTRPRSKSDVDKKKSTAAPSGRSRGRPKTPVSSESKKREPSRSRSRPRASAKKEKEVKPEATRRSSRARSTSKSRTYAKPRARDESPKLKNARLALTDVVRSGSSDINELIRRSLSRDVTGTEKDSPTPYVRRSTRVAAKEDVAGKKEAPWVSDLKPATSKPTDRVEFGGWLGALAQIIGMFLLAGTVLLGCTKDQCVLKSFHIPRNWRVYLNVEAAASVLGFLVIQALLSILPIGRVVKIPNGSNSFRANGFLAVILTGAGVAAAWHYRCPVTLVYERWIPTAVSAYATAWLLALVLFVKGGYAPVPGLNPYGNSGNRLYDFFAGREVTPFLFSRINVKLVLLRSCVIATLVLDSLLALKGYEVRKEISPTLLTAIALRGLYCLDVLWFEESFSSTFEAQYDGFGFMNIQSLMLYPFVTGIIPRFILTHRIELSVYVLAASVALYLVGYFIYRASNLQKATFRKNPHDPTISHLETIATNRGKKLLVSGWWGLVKHPNYLGDIILHWAMTLPCGFTHAFPYIVPLLMTFSFVYRAKRDDRRCKERYQGAWTEYSRRVPNYLIPKVY